MVIKLGEGQGKGGEKFTCVVNTWKSTRETINFLQASWTGLNPWEDGTPVQHQSVSLLQSDYNIGENYIKTGNFTWCRLLGWGLIFTSQTIGILIMIKSSQQIGFFQLLSAASWVTFKLFLFDSHQVWMYSVISGKCAENIPSSTIQMLSLPRKQFHRRLLCIKSELLCAAAAAVAADRVISNTELSRTTASL